MLCDLSVQIIHAWISREQNVLPMASPSMLGDLKYEPFISLVFQLNQILLFQKKKTSPWELGLLQHLRYNSFRMPLVVRKFFFIFMIIRENYWKESMVRSNLTNICTNCSVKRRLLLTIELGFNIALKLTSSNQLFDIIPNMRSKLILN